MNNRSSVFCSFDRFCKKYERKQNGAIENNTPTKQNETKNNKTTKQQNNKTKQNETKRKQNKTRKTQQEQEQEQEKGKEKKKRNTQDTTRQNAPPYVLAHLPFNATQRTRAGALPSWPRRGEPRPRLSPGVHQHRRLHLGLPGAQNPAAAGLHRLHAAGTRPAWKGHTVG